MNQTHYKILKMLYDKDKVSAVNSISLNEITDCSIFKFLYDSTKVSILSVSVDLNKSNIKLLHI